MAGNDRSDPDPLAPFQIPGLPPSFYYIADFIREEEEASILQKIPSQRWVTLSHRRLQAHPSTLTAKNTLLAAPLPEYLINPVVTRFKSLGVFNNTPHKEPNHVLINEYKRGEGIMPHEDGSAYAHVVATVSLGAPICLELTRKKEGGKEEGLPESSIGGDDVRDGPTKESNAPHNSEDNLPARILQEPRSLLITTGPAYTDLLHGIASVEVDENLGPETVVNWNLLSNPGVFANGRNERETRVSLTYRDVLKVSSALGKVFGASRRI